ncbi:9894_t:CDS:1 [Cetraspora pellucida]|uniref:9894_t:CDS:1 n=1 Tax=Cetraspora pellucida TaxID=1433469 RepID=A0A9N9CIB4_9GLOM|nr:9894_t:CDS:1 [Cetraspora pellucida]
MPPRLIIVTSSRPTIIMPPRLAKVMPPRSAKLIPSRPIIGKIAIVYKTLLFHIYSKSEKIKHINDYLCSNILFKLDDSTYDSLEDDVYNVDEGRPLDNLSRKNLEREEKNDNNNYRNPAEWQEMLNQN